MAAIRETLFSALADVLSSSSALLARLQLSDAEKPRAFFAALALAVLLVCTTRVDLAPPPRVKVLSFSRSDMPPILDLEHCPAHLRPLLQGLFGIAALARQTTEADDRAAIERAMNDEPDVPSSIDRLRQHFLDESSVLLCVASRTGSRMALTASRLPNDLQRLANAINEAALGISALPDFVARQAYVFDILSGVAPDPQA